MWLSLVERFVRDEEVACSNPVTPTIQKAHEIGLFIISIFFAFLHSFSAWCQFGASNCFFYVFCSFFPQGFYGTSDRLLESPPARFGF